ncbi:phage tail protein [Pseudomonas shirazensis]|uniref:phage tail-collar fiber domain-containing protein n=1 Tax=Pseudomonas shirazensis TaxID=2745494 RepID=UPI003D0907D6
MVDQNSQFYAILTNVGAAKQANADALGIAWKITQMGVGDANGTDPTPNATQQRLINEWRRAPLNQLKVDDNDMSIIVAEQVIPADIGGKWIREIGLYDEDGDLVAVANCAPTYKPLLSQGSGRTQVVRLSLVVSSSANVQLKIDPSVVLATREWVTEELARQDFKHSVLVATTGNIALSGLPTVDGVVLTAGKRVLVRAQTAAKDNGIYVAGAGAWTRAADANTNAKVTPGLLVAVEQGTLYGDSAWQLVTDGTISLGVTALGFEMAYGRTGVAAGTYRSVQVDKYGRVVSATNPTTVAGYGITDVYTKSETYSRTEANQAIKGAVDTAVSALVDSAPGSLDTLKELAAALGNDANFAATVIAGLAEKAALNSPKFTGAPETPTPAAGSTGLQVANMSALATAVSTASRSLKAAVIGVSTNLTLKPEQAGNAVQFNATGLTLTLPTVASAGNGATFTMRNPTASTQTLVVAGNGAIAGMVTSTSATIKAGEWIEVAASGSSWFVIGGGKLKEVAELDSPVFTGDPQVPTKAVSDRSASAASTKFVGDLLASLGLGTSDLADLATGTDLNTLNVGGTYQVNGTVNAPPGSSTSGILAVVGTNAQNYTHQLFFPQAINKMYHRCSYGVTNGVITWRDWDENPDLSTVKSLLQASRRYFSGNVIGVAVATVLTAAQTGYSFNVTNAVTVTLPAAADAGSGGSFTIRNVSAGNVTIALPSGAVIYVKAGSANSLVLAPNEWVELQASTSNYFLNGRGKLGEVAETESPTFTGEVKIKGANVLRMINDLGQYGVIQRVDNTSYYLLLTESGDASGNFNGLRPLQVEFATGLVRLNNGATVAAPGDDDNSARIVNSAWVKRKTDAAAPPGQVAHFATTSPPAGWLKRNGAAYSRTSYAALFAVIGTKFGAGDGSTTFNVPDDRELVDRAWTDGLNAADAGRELFSTQAGQIESHTHSGSALSAGSHSHAIENKREYVDSVTTNNINAVYGDEIREGTGTTSTSTSGAHSHALSITATGGNETRMANRAYLACIKF